MEEAVIVVVEELAESSESIAEQVAETIIVYDETLHTLVEGIANRQAVIEQLLQYVSGFVLFFVIVALLYFIYKFIRLFF